MSLIALKDVGKIYVSEGNVAVGIRGVDLSFERGEFVAITGRSGSGKSTLLNVISGMDTYEEGEMFVENEPTSHYLQPDWEEYRKKYISFIFQDYNIIESFTVLQNVELALMHITNSHERRKRAIELLTRVGLKDHLYHKGSKLSGGQKQRTVIARALAKDSPIILADEPTGNLDSHTSEEIIELLKEVSKDKLVIVVTHNFEQVSHCATRHIRVFDGAIEFDHKLNSDTERENDEATETKPAGKRKADSASDITVISAEKAKKAKKAFADGITLGRTRFAAMPKLSAFICILMVIATLAVTLLTSLSAESISELFEKEYIFTHIDGRTVIVRTDGAMISDDELSEIAQKTGAKDFMHYDYLLDKRSYSTRINKQWYSFDYGFDEFDDIDEGRAPQTDSEVLLCMPISFKTYFANGEFSEFKLEDFFDMVDYTVTGIRYYYDNTRYPKMIFTKSGYETAAAISYFSQSSSTFKAELKVNDSTTGDTIQESTIESSKIAVDFGLEGNSYYVYSKVLRQAIADGIAHGLDPKLEGKLSGGFTSYFYGNSNSYYGYYDYNVGDVLVYGKATYVEYSLDKSTQLDELPESLKWMTSSDDYELILSPELIREFVYGEYFSKAYTQASLFYGSDAEAEKKAEQLQDMGYLAVPSNSEAPQDDVEALLKYLVLIFPFVGWVLAVMFIAIFLSLCTSKAMMATKGDIAILRSMGIPTETIKVSIYIQNIIAVLPAYIITAITCTVIYTVPKTNGMFTFLHAPYYIVIALSVLAIAILLSKRHAKHMFGSSVKKTLRSEQL